MTEPIQATIDPVQLSAGPPRRREGRRTRRTPGGRSSFAGRAARFLLPVGFGAAVLGLWYLTSYRLLNTDRRFIMPPPHQVIKVGFLDSDNFKDEIGPLWTTTKVALVGLLVAVILGFAIAMLMSQARWVETTLYPYAVALQTIPVLALVPLIAFVLGYGFWSRVIVCILIAIFPIITNTLFGLQAADQPMHDLFTLHGAGRLTRLRKLQLPNALPAIFTGLRISAGLSVIGAIVGDFFFRQGEPGIGLQIDNYRNSLQSEQLFAAIILSSALGLIVFWAFGWLNKIATGSWYRPGRG